MKTAGNELHEIVATCKEQLKRITEADAAKKINPDKWSKKEELGHLVDSAFNNHRRFIVAQYEHHPKIVYDQNYWVQAGHYQQQPFATLVSLWEILNLQICEVLESIPHESFEKTCNTGKDEIELHTIRWLASDYVKHLLHHLHHILELEEIPY